jgi:N-acetylglucosamine kinase-like BadF-type ATPase
MTFIGIDGGGTTTRFFVQRETGEAEYFERPISLKVVDGDFAASAEKLREVLSDVAVTFKSRSYENDHSHFDRDPSASSGQALKVTATIAIGLSGMSREADQDALKAAIWSLPEFSKTTIHIEPDATMTMKAVLPEGEEGILLIAGTGSVIFYQPLGQSARRIGGWGPFLSDDGSGYRIGLRALRRYFWTLDGVYPPDPLTERIGVRLIERGLKDAQDRREITRLAERDRAFVASLARDALETASMSGIGEVGELIKRMIHEEMIELVTQILPVFFRGVMSGNAPYKLYLSGSIAKHPVMLEALGSTFDQTDVTPILVDDSTPAMKALEIAKELVQKSPSIVNEGSGNQRNGILPSLV